MVDKIKTETKEAKKIVQGSCVITMKFLDETGRECTETKDVTVNAESFVLGGRMIRVN
jgi:hypothetical protein